MMLISQGEIVAKSLKQYLIKHKEIEMNCEKNKQIKFYTTENNLIFNSKASLFFQNQIFSKHIKID